MFFVPDINWYMTADEVAKLHEPDEETMGVDDLITENDCKILVKKLDTTLKKLNELYAPTTTFLIYNGHSLWTRCNAHAGTARSCVLVNIDPVNHESFNSINENLRLRTFYTRIKFYAKYHHREIVVAPPTVSPDGILDPDQILGPSN